MDKRISRRARGSRARLAYLSLPEEKAWQFAFEYHLTSSKQGQDEAARRAWRDTQREFPRLKNYAGCHP